MRPTRSCLPLLAAAALLGACGGDAVTAPAAADVVGTYTLRDVGGLALPAAVQATSSTVRVHSASRTFRADGTCDFAGRYSFTDTMGRVPPSDYETAGPCTWTLAGDVVTVLANERGVATTRTLRVAAGGTLLEFTGYREIGDLRYVR